jgi:hypothetical protein
VQKLVKRLAKNNASVGANGKNCEADLKDQKWGFVLFAGRRAKFLLGDKKLTQNKKRSKSNYCKNLQPIHFRLNNLHNL